MTLTTLVCPLSQLAKVTLTSAVRFCPLKYRVAGVLTLAVPTDWTLLIVGLPGSTVSGNTLMLPTFLSSLLALAFQPAACAPATRGVHW